MRVVILTCYESNEGRVDLVSETCRKRKDEVIRISSDFSHVRKESRTVPEGYESIPTLPYRKNLSLARIRSHRQFAADAFDRVEALQPDLIWLMAPANSLIREADRYKRKHPECKLIIDIIDMWPESLPLAIRKDVFPLNLWRNIRSRHIGCADALVSECDLYQEILKTEYAGRITTLHWAKDLQADREKTQLPEDRLVLCYIGSINHIIDTERIAALIRNIPGKVLLHVIGNGESKDSFLAKMREVCGTIYHGEIRDEKAKAEIFRNCHAGINIYREGLYIGLTVKCIDYFCHGLPILNNIKGDTWEMVGRYHAGFNIEKDTVVSPAAIRACRKQNEGIYELYENNFTADVFLQKCEKLIDEVTA